MKILEHVQRLESQKTMTQENKMASGWTLTKFSSMGANLIISIISIAALLPGSSYAKSSIITYSGEISGQIQFNDIRCFPRTNQDINVVSATSKTGITLVFKSRFYSITTTDGKVSFLRSSNSQGISWQHRGENWTLKLSNVALPSATAPEIDMITSGRTKKIILSGTLSCTAVGIGGHFKSIATQSQPKSNQ